MKNQIKNTIFGFLIGLTFLTGIVSAQISGGITPGSFWYGDGVNIYPVDSTWGLDQGSGNITTTGTLGAGATTLDRLLINMVGVSNFPLDVYTDYGGVEQDHAFMFDTAGYFKISPDLVSTDSLFVADAIKGGVGANSIVIAGSIIAENGFYSTLEGGDFRLGLANYYGGLVLDQTADLLRFEQFPLNGDRSFYIDKDFNLGTVGTGSFTPADIFGTGFFYGVKCGLVDNTLGGAIALDVPGITIGSSSAYQRILFAQDTDSDGVLDHAIFDISSEATDGFMLRVNDLASGGAGDMQTIISANPTTVSIGSGLLGSTVSIAEKLIVSKNSAGTGTPPVHEMAEFSIGSALLGERLLFAFNGIDSGGGVEYFGRFGSEIESPFGSIYSGKNDGALIFQTNRSGNPLNLEFGGLGPNFVNAFILTSIGDAIHGDRLADKVGNADILGNGTLDPPWYAGAGWTYYNNGNLTTWNPYDHSVVHTNGGGTATFYQAVAPVANKRYLVNYQVSKHTAGTVTMSLGGTNGTVRTAAPVGGIRTASLGVGGTGYTQDDVLTLAGGNGQVTVDVTAGIVTGIKVEGRARPNVKQGYGYVAGSTYATTGGTGTGCTITVDTTRTEYSDIIDTINTTDLIFTPSNTFDGEMDNIQVFELIDLHKVIGSQGYFSDGLITKGTNLLGGNTTIGLGTAATDYTLTFDGETNDGVLTWMEDEDYFLFGDDFFLNKVMYKDINIAGALLSKPASSAPGTDTFRSTGGTDTTIETYAFALDEKVHGGFELQHDYKEGTDLIFHVHWQGIAAPAGGTDNVQWRLNYIVSRDGVTLAAATVIDSPDVAINTQYRAYRSDFGAITGTNFKIGDQFMFTLTRVAAVSDDYAGDCLIETAGIHYQVDTLGSRATATK